MLELKIDTRRDAFQLAARKAMRATIGHAARGGIERSLRGRIVAVRRDTVPAGAEVIVRGAVVIRDRTVDIERRPLVERMPPGQRVQVGSVVWIGAAGRVVLARVTRRRT